VRIDGEDYVGVSYRSTATAIRTGPVSLGPGEARLTISAQVADRGINIRQNIATQLQVSQREFRARPLPPGAPPR
ncbi:MAG: hypothetical protein GWO24_24430, partial [Akkermansiaceae bacterium]|nr:hypothetical protein [Akkermansiaceae bacterium]